MERDRVADLLGQWRKNRTSAQKRFDAALDKATTGLLEQREQWVRDAIAAALIYGATCQRVRDFEQLKKSLGRKPPKAVHSAVEELAVDAAAGVEMVQTWAHDFLEGALEPSAMNGGAS